MLKLNENYLKLPGSYLFAEVARRAEAAARYREVAARLQRHPLFGAGRLVRAFPNLRSLDHTEVLALLRRHLKTRDFPPATGPGCFVRRYNLWYTGNNRGTVCIAPVPKTEREDYYVCTSEDRSPELEA